MFEIVDIEKQQGQGLFIAVRPVQFDLELKVKMAGIVELGEIIDNTKLPVSLFAFLQLLLFLFEVGIKLCVGDSPCNLHTDPLRQAEILLCICVLLFRPEMQDADNLTPVNEGNTHDRSQAGLEYWGKLGKLAYDLVKTLG